MGFSFARPKMRGRVAVLGAVALALTGIALTRQTGVEAHTVDTDYPVTCSMVGLAPHFTSEHIPLAGTTAGAALTLSVNLKTPAVNQMMDMQTTRVSFTLPKPALTSRITGVTFKAGTGNFAGSATVNATTGLMTFTFTGSAMSNAIDLQDFDIASVTATTAMAGERVQWIGPSSIVLTNGTMAVDTCNPASGAAIPFAPTVVLDPNAGCTTTTEDPAHGHGAHGPDPCATTTTATPPTTRATTATTPTTRATTATTPTTRATTATTPTTRATTATTRSTTPTTARPTTTMRPGGGGLLALLWQLICRLFGLC